MKKYRADYADESFIIINSKTNKKAIEIALCEEQTYGTLFNVTLIDCNYNDIKTIF